MRVAAREALPGWMALLVAAALAWRRTLADAAMVIFILAGLYLLSPLREACLARCRLPRSSSSRRRHPSASRLARSRAY